MYENILHHIFQGLPLEYVVLLREVFSHVRAPLPGALLGGGEECSVGALNVSGRGLGALLRSLRLLGCCCCLVPPCPALAGAHGVGHVPGHDFWADGCGIGIRRGAAAAVAPAELEIPDLHGRRAVGCCPCGIAPSEYRIDVQRGSRRAFLSSACHDGSFWSGEGVLTKSHRIKKYKFMIGLKFAGRYDTLYGVKNDKVMAGLSWFRLIG